MRMLRIAVILFLSMVINYQAQAQTNNSELKIGYVNPQSILANMPESVHSNKYFKISPIVIKKNSQD